MIRNCIICIALLFSSLSQATMIHYHGGAMGMMHIVTENVNNNNQQISIDVPAEWDFAIGTDGQVISFDNISISYEGSFGIYGDAISTVTTSVDYSFNVGTLDINPFFHVYATDIVTLSLSPTVINGVFNRFDYHNNFTINSNNVNGFFGADTIDLNQFPISVGINFSGVVNFSPKTSEAPMLEDGVKLVGLAFSPPMVNGGPAIVFTVPEPASVMLFVLGFGLFVCKVCR